MATERYRAALLALVALSACGDGGGSTAVDAGVDAGTPKNLFEQLVLGGEWGEGVRDLGCTIGCRFVTMWKVERGATASDFIVTRRLFWDVVPTDPTIANGKVAGDQFCLTTYQLTLQSPGAVDPMLRSIANGALSASDCAPGAVGLRLSWVVDAPAASAGAVPPLVTYFFGDTNPPTTVPWRGYPMSATDQSFVRPLVRCPTAAHAPGRAYCMPACDFPGADPGRTQCGFPSFDPPPPFPDCNTVVNTGASIEQTRLAENRIAPAGGTVLDGTYHLVRSIVYTGPGGATGGTGTFQKATGVVVGDAVQMALEFPVGNAIYANFMFLRSGASTVVTQTCPERVGVIYDSYSASGDQLTLYDTVGSTALEFTRMP